MPVLSPHRSSSSGLSGSYRPIYSSSGVDRPYLDLGSHSYIPRVRHHTFRTSSYSDSDGRRVIERSGSITEDGITTRFYEESRDGSVPRRDSVTYRDGSSYRDRSVDTSPRRDSSLSRAERLSTINVIDSVAEMRNKYSPANYVPAILRNKNENISRSKSINDIGLPPIEKSGATKKKVINDSSVHSSNNHSNGVSDLISNNTNNPTKPSDFFNTDALLEDDNGNRASVADLCKKFNEKGGGSLKIAKTGNGAIRNGGTKSKSTATPPEKTNAAKSKPPPAAIINNITAAGVSKKLTVATRNKNKNDSSGAPTDSALTEKIPKKCQNGVVFQSKFEVNGLDGNNGVEGEEKEDPTQAALTGSSRVNHFSSYIPYHERTGKEEGEDEVNNANGQEESMENGKDNSLGKIIVPNEVGVSPKLSSRTPISPSSSRRSNDREISYRRRPTEDLDALRSSAGPRTLGLNGLKNIGNTCFMNSVIQCLSNTRLLLEYVIRDAYVRDINTTTSQMKGALIKAFAEVIKELWSEDSSDRVVNTVSLKSQIQRFAPRFMGYAQQDAQEFLRYLLEGLHEDVNRVIERPKPIVTEIDDKLSDSEKSSESWSRYLRMDNSKIVDIFVGQLKSTLRCTYCGHCSVTFDPFWDLSVPIPQRVGQLRLQQCLDSFTREETLDGDEKPTCSKCKERRKCTKSLAIQKFPRILVIHLKRFSPTERFRGKLNVTIDFPLEGLDVSSYAAGGVTPARYALYAVSNHSGTTYSGHYTASCRHPYNNSWHEYNDSRVSSIHPRSSVSSEAYVLFYEQEGVKSHL